jgi:hypothetical protein
MGAGNGFLGARIVPLGTVEVWRRLGRLFWLGLSVCVSVFLSEKEKDLIDGILASTAVLMPSSSSSNFNEHDDCEYLDEPVPLIGWDWQESLVGFWGENLAQAHSDDYDAYLTM